MPIATVETRRLYRQIAAQLSALIASGEFAVGQRLPSERELAAQLGVSRPSLREALIALELEGLVEVRVGAGIWVTAASGRDPSTDPHGQQEGEGPFELLRARWLIEGEIAAAAAREATDVDLASIRTSLTEMERLLKKNTDFSDFDREFHLRIARSTHNGVLQSVVEDLWDRGRGAIWRLMEQHFQTPALRAASVNDHRAIFQALLAHDPREARNAMRAHLQRVDSEFARGWEPIKGREAAESTARPARKPRRSAARSTR
jgi:GntR family transcriptional regulator, uxu operon transcriptional repressor